MQKIIPYHTYEYGDQPEVIATAPGRFHILGEHLWFAQDDTLSVAINRQLQLCASRRSDTNFRLYSVSLDERRKISITSLRYKKEDRWANSVKAVISAFLDHGFEISGLNFTILSEIPSDAGLGTPNALKVATGLAIRQIFAPEITISELADILEYANIQALNSHAHRADIYTALFAKAGMCIRTEYRKKTVSYCQFPPEGYSIVLTDSKIPHAIARDELNARIQECVNAYELVKKHPDSPRNMRNLTEDFLQEVDIPESVKRRVVYVIRESAGIDSVVKALEKGDSQAFTRLVARSHEGLRDRFEISAPELDWLVKRTTELSETSDQDSFVCARLTGKGFGGCTYSLLKEEQVPLFTGRAKAYEQCFGFLPVAYIVKTDNGATIQTL